MELIKERENITKSYEGGKETSIVTSVSSKVMEGSNQVGNCELRADGFSVSVYGLQGKTVEQVSAMVAKMFATLITQ